MTLRNIIAGTVITIIVLIFLFFVLRSCTRDTSGARASLTTSTSGGAVTTSTTPGNSAAHLTDCTPDPETGICNPIEPEKRPFDKQAFMAMVMEHQQASSSSSSSSPATGTGSRFWFSRSGGSSGGSGGGSAGGSGISNGGSGSGNGNGQNGDDGNGGNGNSGDNNGNENGNGNGGSPNDNSGVTTGTGSLSGTYGPLPTGRCKRSRSLLSIFDLGDSTRGSEPVTFPVIINGDCPITAAILKWHSDSPFNRFLDF